MRQLSSWAACNLRTSRSLIAGCYLLANLFGHFWALLLDASGYEVPGGFLAGLVLVTIAALLLYPRRDGMERPKPSYFLRKSVDLVLCLATVALVACTTAGALKSVTPAQASFRYSNEASTGKQTNTRETGSVKGVGRIIRSVRQWYTELETWQKVLLMILTIVGTVFLSIVWAALCCSIACNGAEALALVLLLLGWGGLVTGCVFICRRIVRGPSFIGPQPLKR